MIGPEALVGLTLGVLVLGVVGWGLLVADGLRRSELVALGTEGAERPEDRSWRRRLDVRIRATPFGSRLAAKLRAASVDLSVVDAILVVAAASVAAVLVLGRLVGIVGSVLLVLSLVAGANRWLNWKMEQRIEAFVAQLPEVARVLANAASAGLALRSAVGMAGRELPDPAGEEFRQVGEAMAVGQPLNEALDAVQKRLPSRELSVLVQTLVIQSRTGGALVSALQNIALTLEQRKELRREVRTVVSGAVFGGYVVTFLGVMAVFIMNLLSPGALDSMVGTFLGRIVLLVAAAFFFAGYFLINRMTRIEV